MFERVLMNRFTVKIIILGVEENNIFGENKVYTGFKYEDKWKIFVKFLTGRKMKLWAIL